MQGIALNAQVPPARLAVVGVAAASSVFLLARGFGSSRKSNKEASEERQARKLKGKIMGCTACGGTGKKPCPICKGSKRMSGFLGADVACVPCDAAGTLGRPCVECGGLGLFNL